MTSMRAEAHAPGRRPRLDLEPKGKTPCLDHVTPASVAGGA
jgi:hypothetical protein